MKVFIAGAKSIKSLDEYTIKKLTSICEKQYDILVGDCDGVDALVQQFLAEIHYNRVNVYASNGKARNNIGGWDIKHVAVPSYIRGFAYYQQKDIAMANETDLGFMIWDGKSRGTKANIEKLASLGKYNVIHVTDAPKSYVVRNTVDLSRFFGERKTA